MKIELVDNKGFCWTFKKAEKIKIWCKGDAFIFDNYLSEKDLPNHIFEALESYGIDGIAKELSNWNGSFAGVIEADSEVILFTDRLRSFSLFYYIGEDNLMISDMADRFIGLNKDIQLDEEAINEFKMFGYVTGNETLLKEIKQVRAAEIIVINKSSKQLKSLFYYEDGYERNKEIADLTIEEKIDYLDDVLNNVFKRLIKDDD